MAEEVRRVIRTDRGGRRTGFRVLAGVLLLAGLAWWFWPEEETRSWAFATVDRGDMVLTATATGNLEPKSEISVGAEISGLVDEVLVDWNDRVEVGTVLARFDTDSLEITLEQAEARLALTRASVAEARATLEEAELDEARAVRLVESRNLPQSELDAARAVRKPAAARVDSAEASVREARQRCPRSAPGSDKAVIRSPIRGVVLQRSVEPGNTVAANFQAPELFILAEELERMELHVALDEADVGLVAAGQPAIFRVDAWPQREFEARVETVHLYPTVASNVVTYTTVLSVDNSEGLLRPGMTATATITTGTREQVLRVPDVALRFVPPVEEESGGITFGPPGTGRNRGDRPANAVWILGEEGPERIPVRAGFSDGRFTELLGAPLEAGDRVLVGVGGDGPAS
ncbi:MAG: efflux RND transporter periplasmic adaptor subunit [Gammaproteobacteria bacterium]|nr:efflux RND transporter periplasmic adaptor subunit [Gammaproteobacteria bacterium]